MILAKGMGTQELALAKAQANRSYRVERVCGPGEQSLRLSELGLVPGADISVLSRNNGMVVVRLGGARLALAGGMADCVLVK